MKELELNLVPQRRSSMTKVKQAVVRTYPNGWNTTTGYLRDYLNDGYIVVMVNEFFHW